MEWRTETIPRYKRRLVFYEMAPTPILKFTNIYFRTGSYWSVVQWNRDTHIRRRTDLHGIGFVFYYFTKKNHSNVVQTNPLSNISATIHTTALYFMLLPTWWVGKEREIRPHDAARCSCLRTGGVRQATRALLNVTEESAMSGDELFFNKYHLYINLMA